ncbi:hypothetical protein KKB18_12500, partial [bacterium]|nr:hypothetical protein [bacterium]
VGTTLRREAEENGWIKLDSSLVYDGSLGNVIETEALSRGEILNLGVLAKKKFYLRTGYILKRFLGIRSLKELNTIIKEAYLLLKGIF